MSHRLELNTLSITQDGHFTLDELEEVVDLMSSSFMAVLAVSKKVRGVQEAQMAKRVAAAKRIQRWVNRRLGGWYKLMRYMRQVNHDKDAKQS